jgi:Domain of unknown function (DUF4352)
MKTMGLLAVTAAVLLVAACAGPSGPVGQGPPSSSVSSPTADQATPPTNTAGRLGTAAQLSMLRVTALSKQGNVVSENQLETPKAGNQFLALEVLYEATGTQKLSFNPFSEWKISDAAGQVYPATYVSGKSPELQSGELAPGDKARGWITFEIPAGAAGLTAIVVIGNETAAFIL